MTDSIHSRSTSSARNTFESSIRHGAFEGIAAALRTASPTFKFLAEPTQDSRQEIQHYVCELAGGETIWLKIGRDLYIRSYLQVSSKEGMYLCEVAYSASFPDVHGNPVGSWHIDHGPVDHVGIETFLLGTIDFTNSHRNKDFRVLPAGPDGRSWIRELC